MMKMSKIKLVTLGLLIFSLNGFSQKIIDRNGQIDFFSEAPLEDIKAVNNQCLGVVDLTNGKVAVSVLMQGFHFEKSLMEEHFNENYLESDKYPKATFTGEMKDFQKELLINMNDTLRFTTTGTLNIHGVSNPIETVVKFYADGVNTRATTQFLIRIEDYKIEIPKLVIQNIAEEILITSNFSFNVDL